MITRTAPIWQSESWQHALSHSITDYQTLLSRLNLSLEQLEPELQAPLQAVQQFPVRVTESFLARIEPNNPNDPLLRQILPLSAEQKTVPGYISDPLGEQEANPAKGLIHKYKSRALLITTGSCAINCRYCFRREFPYSDNNPSRLEWKQTLEAIQNDTHINEIILSGGDPLVASDQYLSDLISLIEDIPHITRLRLHSRIPIVLPQRMTPELCQRLQDSRLKIILVTHANHPQELNQEVEIALRPYHQAGFTLFNQAVLLKGINDNADTLEALSEGLFNMDVLPYYLHLLDPVSGTAHFDVDQATAISLIQELRNRLPGFLVPTLVKEEAGKASKTAITF